MAFLSSKILSHFYSPAFSLDYKAEELNRFREEDAGKHWGYPYCWTEYKLDDAFGLGRGTAWAWPSFMDNITDAQCRNDYQPAVMSMQAHTAPLGIVFYNYTKDRPKTCTGGFPPEMDGYAFIALHGSWNRNVPVGYSVVYARMDANGDPMDDEPVDFLTHKLPGAKWGDGFRPVDVDFDTCGRLLVSSDGTKSLGYGGSKVVRVEHHEELVGGPAPSGNTNVAITPSLAPVQSDTQPASSSSSTVTNRLLFGETALTLLFGIVHLLA